ncbi:TPA: radical SAM protein [Candidatus Scatenecus faecavium]|uniref:Radical SAM protein n=1 Tax=Candidatus Scatenecus faecavium TaxID=2840915 RepID=A0A9D1FX77_9BACT|nr:radical SAM protein [Candidatus Scatenecus faecavium]
MTNLFQAQTCQLKELNNLFIELTAKNCNQRCKHCYIDFPLSKNVKDFISIDLIKEALNDTKSENIECIYLTGAEPMTHPDFNSILRLCLKRTNVCICTNGSFINEKKARFLKRVEDESNFEIIFQLSIDHYNEVKSDDIRGRGTYRQVLHAVKSLIKYGFNPILCVRDFYNEGREKILEGFKPVCEKIGFDACESNFKINNFYDKNSKDEIEFQTGWESLDCEHGRMLTAKGVYTCPFLANDHRGRSGADFKDYSRKNHLETDFCASCMKNKKQMFSIDFKKFS